MLDGFRIWSVILNAGLLVLAGFGIGFPLSGFFAAERRNRALIAPVLGLGVWTTLALPALHAARFGPLSVLVVFALVATAAWVVGRRTSKASLFEDAVPVSYALIAAAALIAVIPALCVSPQLFAGGIGFGPPIFDHAKAVIIDEIHHSGLPCVNPFFQEEGASNLLVYYYGWYFLGAQVAALTGGTGWEVDVGFTWVTGFLSLVTMAWAATAYGRRRAAGWWALAICLTSSLLPVINFLIGPWIANHLVPEHGLETWVVQSAWVPQHLFGANLAFLALLGIVRLLQDKSVNGVLGVIVGLLIAACYLCSAWVAQAGLAPILVVIGLIALICRGPTAGPLWAVLANLAVAAVTSLFGSAIFLVLQASRLEIGAVIKPWLFPVVTRDGGFWNDVANVVLYWGGLQFAFFGFAYAMTWVWMFSGPTAKRKDVPRLDLALGLAFLVPLAVAESFESVIANNDLGWRAVLVAVFATTTVAAVTVAECLEGGTSAWRRAANALVACLLIPGVLCGLQFATRVNIVHRLYGQPNAESDQFLREPEMWRAVRAQTAEGESIAVNPLHGVGLTPWPVNISWALLSQRGICISARTYLLPMAARPRAELDEASALVERVFGGDATQADLQLLKQTYRCQALVVQPTDRLWTSDLLADSPYYRLVDSRADAWRIYR